MRDLYFNELSVDYSFSVQPKDEAEAKKLLLQFIQVYFTYKVCAGLESVSVLSNERLSVTKIIDLHRNDLFFSALDEFEEKDLISDFQKKMFKAAIAESFSNDSYPEFQYSTKVVFGFGKAVQNNKYSISYSTDILGIKGSWNNFLFEVQEYIINEEGSIISTNRLAKNIATQSHVIERHEIWKSCGFKNNDTSKSLLPKKLDSEFIIKAFLKINWIDFYANQHTISDVTLKKKIGTVVANINGWNDFRTSDGRKTFQAQNKYLAIDTQHSTYEYYIGLDDHKGEIKFNDDTVDSSKADKTRRVQPA